MIMRVVSAMVATSRRTALQQFAEFIRAQGHVLVVRPWLTCQQAASGPETSAPASVALHRLTSGLEKRPCLRRVNSSASDCLMTLPGRGGCAFDPGGTRIVAGGRDNDVKVWDSASGKEIAVLVGHRGLVHACVFSPDGSHIPEE